MKQEDLIKKMYEQAKIDTRGSKDEAVLKKMKETFLEQSKVEPQMVEPSIWSKFMKSKLTKLAAAAVIIIVYLIGLSIWRTTGSGIALADVLARVEKVKAVSYKLHTNITDEDPNNPYSFKDSPTYLISQEYGTKWTSEIPNTDEGYILPQKKIRILIQHKQKKYMRTELDDMYVEKQLAIANPTADALDYLKDILKYKYMSLGRSTINGVEVAGFRSTDPNPFIEEGWPTDYQYERKLWVDVKTLLPMRYEWESFYQAGGSKNDRMHYVYYDFQWDVPIDAADFEPPPVPDGYTSFVLKLPPNNEETAIQGLKQSVEFFGGYPEVAHISYRRVNRLLGNKAALQERLREAIKGLTEDEILNKLLMPTRGLEKFVYRLDWEKKDLAYYGLTVTPKDADKILMRWKISDNEYRIIYGDLHAETVSSDKLAELEKLNLSAPLHNAVRAGDIEQVKLLISKGADVNAKDARGFTPLHRVCFSISKNAIAELLIDKGANVNARITDVNDGRTTLHCVATSGNVEIGKLLIAKGVNIDAKENNGGTPLHRACLSGRKNVVVLLIAKGADLNVKNNKGQTALSLAKEGKYKEIVELLLKNGAKE